MLLPLPPGLQLSAAQDQASTLQALVQQLEKENTSLERDLAAQKRDLSDIVEEQQAAADKMGRLLQGRAVTGVCFQLGCGLPADSNTDKRCRRALQLSRCQA